MDFVIRDDVHKPERKNAARASKYPFEQLAVGQSFHVPGVSVSSLSASARRVAKSQNPEWKFAVWKADDNGVDGTWVERKA